MTERDLDKGWQKHIGNSTGKGTEAQKHIDTRGQTGAQRQREGDRPTAVKTMKTTKYELVVVIATPMTPRADQPCDPSDPYRRYDPYDPCDP